MYSGIVLLASLTGGNSTPVDAGWFESKDLFPPDVYLVHSKAIKIDEQKYADFYLQKATFSIDRVYIGDDELKGRTFQVEVSRIRSGMRPIFIDDKLSIKKGEQGIWWIRRDPTSKRLVADIRPTLYMQRVGGFGPARDVTRDDSFDPLQFPIIHCNSYKKGLLWAEKYERLYKADAMDRIALLEEYAREKEPLLAGRAVALLAYCGMSKPDYVKSLTTLTEVKNLSIGAQLAIDNAMIWIHYRHEDLLKTWFASPKHLKFVRQWVTDDFGDPDTTTILELDIQQRFVGHKSSVEYLDYATLLQIAVTGIANEKRSERFKKKCLMQTATKLRPKDAAGSKAGFDYLIGVVKGRVALPVKVAAARLLTVLAPLSTDQAQRVQSLLKTVESRQVADYLRTALKATKTKKVIGSESK